MALEIDRDGLVLLGPNGAGKTTLLHLLLGVLRPRAGRIAIDDEVLFDSGLGLDRATELRGIGYVPQGSGLFPHMTGLENVAFAMAARGLAQAQARADALQCLTAHGLSNLADRHASRLSGGERQRIALERALAGAPRVLLLDEPLAAIDSHTRRGLRETLRARIEKAALPTIVVTHSIGDAVALGARIAVMAEGHVVQTGSFAELRAAPASDIVAQVLADDP